MKVYIDALGCKLNQSEIEVLARRFAGAGHRLVGAPQDADLCVLNTCTVTHVAARKSRQALRRLHRANPEARIAAIGCYAEMEPEVVQDLPGIAWVVGNHDKERLVEWVAGPGREGPAPTLASRRTRGLVKIQDGCDNACSYCIVHVVRGAQRSRPPEEVLAEIVAAVAAGTQEIVLTGVHIGAYGRDTRRGLGDRQGFMDLWGLVRRILEETELPRLRLSSIEPWDAPSEEALALWADERLCAHLHLPLQAGADATLRRMGRRYSSADYARLVEAARAAIPDLAVTTDVMAGFPGETEADFRTSLEFVEAMGFARVHVFPYSAREGTPAARLPAPVPAPTKMERAAALRRVGKNTAQAFRQRFVGRRMEVLWERRDRATGEWAGLTSNYLRVTASSEADLHNTLTPVRLEAVGPHGLRGTILG